MTSQMFLPFLLLSFVMLASMSGHCTANCTFPSSLQNKVWLRVSDKKIIQFTQSGMTGDGFGIKGSANNNFLCLINDGDKYVIKTDKPLTLSSTLDGYFCWQLKNHSSRSIQLYELTNFNINDSDTRDVRIYTTPFGYPTPEFNTVCALDPSDEIPTYLFEVSSATDKDVNVTSLASLTERCPPWLLATYFYLPNGAGSNCSESGSDLDFCVDRQTARINYALCPTRILFTEGGNLSCIATFTVRSAPVAMLLNHDTSLSGNSSRFVCLKMETVGENEEAIATAFPDCLTFRENQTLLLTIKATCRHDPVPCMFPQSLLNRFWYRVSDKKVIEFSASRMSGHSVQLGSLTYGNFTCAATSTNKYIIKAIGVVETARRHFDLYFCWQLTETSHLSYQLYELTAVGGSAITAGIRVYSTRAGNPPPSFNAVCSLNPSDETPTYVFEVTSPSSTDVDVASVSLLTQQCPESLAAKYTYVKDAAECKGRDSELDFCVDKRTARVNYEQCPTEILYSASGVLNCIGTFSVGGSAVAMFLNTDTSLNNSTSRFACMKLETLGDVKLTTISEDCKTNGSSHTLQLSRTGGCESEADNLPLIIGIVAGVVLIVVLLAVGIVVYKRGYLKRKLTSITPSTVSAKEDDV